MSEGVFRLCISCFLISTHRNNPGLVIICVFVILLTFKCGNEIKESERYNLSLLYSYYHLIEFLSLLVKLGVSFVSSTREREKNRQKS